MSRSECRPSPTRFRTLLAIALAFGSAGLPAASAQSTPPQPDQDDLRQLIETGTCGGCSLAGADLRGADLAHAVLRDADLRGADLTGANLLEADLTGADLTGANLAGTDLTGAILTGAIVSKEALAEAVFCYTTLPNGQLFLLHQGCP